MKFIPDPILDVTRQQYKRQYDEVFNRIRTLPVDSSERAELNRQELILHRRTLSFLNKNRCYFSQKRRAIFESIENKGVFGEKASLNMSEKK